MDILKVQFAIEDFESVAGLPESVFATEGFAFVNDLLFSGILFCLLPTLFLVPKLHGNGHRNGRRCCPHCCSCADYESPL